MVNRKTKFYVITVGSRYGFINMLVILKKRTSWVGFGFLFIFGKFDVEAFLRFLFN